MMMNKMGPPKPNYYFRGFIPSYPELYPFTTMVFHGVTMVKQGLLGLFPYLITRQPPFLQVDETRNVKAMNSAALQGCLFLVFKGGVVFL